MADVGEQGTAVSALKSLCEMMKKSPGDLQKALLRPGTVEFELIASAVKQAELDEAKFVTSQASAPSQATAPSQAPLDKANLSPRNSSQQVEDYLSGAYERSHRGRESPCESEAEMPAQPQPVKGQPMEIVPQVSQQPDPLKNSQSQPMEIVPQVFQQPDPVKNSQSQPMEIVPAAQGHEAVSQQPQPDFMNQVQLTAPALQQAAQVSQQSEPFKNPSQPAATVVQDLPPQSQGQPGRQFDAMPPPIQIPDRSAVNPAPNSSAPTTPIPSDAEDEKALRDMKDKRV